MLTSDHGPSLVPWLILQVRGAFPPQGLPLVSRPPLSATLFSKLGCKAWPSMDVVFKRAAELLALAAAAARPPSQPPLPLGAGTPAGAGFDASRGGLATPPPAADSASQRSLYDQVQYMEGYRRRWWRQCVRRIPTRGPYQPLTQPDSPSLLPQLLTWVHVRIPRFEASHCQCSRALSRRSRS